MDFDFRGVFAFIFVIGGVVFVVTWKILAFLFDHIRFNWS